MISSFFAVQSAERDILTIISSSMTVMNKKKEVGSVLQKILKQHGCQFSNQLIHKLGLKEKVGINFFCPALQKINRNKAF